MLVIVKKWFPALTALLASLSGGSVVAQQPAAEAAIDFHRDVRPILSDHCFRCHGPDANHREGGLRLDLREAALQELESGSRAIVPGQTADSALVTRIRSDDDALRMPPPEARKPLSPRQQQILQRWVAEGAPYAQHWSLTPPRKTEPPKIELPRNVAAPAPERDDWDGAIDRFVLAGLQREGLQPSPPADRSMLIRRLSLDLTGLPPSAEEVEAFLADRRPDAVQRLVDRLLDSPHYGERMALPWLDSARYADTNGFSIDGGRHMWLWRDWVIDAFNRNLPYDRFLLEQLAGDRLPHPDVGQLIATGFQRNNMVTHEGGTIPAENLANYVADRVKTLGESVLGLTLACAQCHDHKYDPISQRDYYRLAAYFNTASDVGLDGNSGRNPRPTLQARTVLQTGEQPQIERELQTLRKRLAAPSPAAVAAWEAQQRRHLAERGRGLQLNPVKLLKVSTPNRGAGFEIDGPHVRITQPSDLIAYDVSLQLPTTSTPITGLRVVFHPEPTAPGGGWGFGPAEKFKPSAGAATNAGKSNDNDPASQPRGSFLLSAFSASSDMAPGDQVNLHRLLAVRQTTANSWQPQHPPGDCLDMRNENGWAPAENHDLQKLGPPRLTAAFREPIDAAETPYLSLQLNFGNGRSQVAARMEIFAVTGIDDDSPLPEDVIAILQTPADSRSAEQHSQLREYFARAANETQPLRTAIANLEERLAVLTQEFPVMVMDVAPQPRETFILHRGDYAQPREKVTAGTPEALPTLPRSAESATAEASPAAVPDGQDRLALAQWLTMPDHPLTSRVAVNRVWQLLFGAGLVRTPADFGAQGEFPTHPELLDYLAVDFVESGWDVKRLVRQIVLSSTYRQTSAASPELLQRDPDNRLLARGPRFRLPAELIRDGALKTSGLLVPRLGGPSVNPYTPGDPWREISHYGSTPATAQTFVQDHGEKLYRRSLYTYWKRTAPPPNMAAFDAPNRETCVVERPSTTTPQQALVLLNDPQFVEAARAFAQRILQRSPRAEELAAAASAQQISPDDRARLRWAWLECLSRPPSDQELSVLGKTLQRERARYAADKAAAEAWLSNGESPRDESLPLDEHAAWAQVAALLLNLSENVTRN